MLLMKGVEKVSRVYEIEEGRAVSRCSRRIEGWANRPESNSTVHLLQMNKKLTIRTAPPSTKSTARYRVGAAFRRGFP